MKKAIISLLIIALLAPFNSLATAQQLYEDDTMLPTHEQLPSIDATIQEVYGPLNKEGRTGVFRIEARIGASRVIWYRNNLDTSVTTLEQVGNDLFSYEKLNTLFSNPDIRAIFFVYCYNLQGGDYSKVLMAAVDRYDMRYVHDYSYRPEQFYRYFSVIQMRKYAFDLP